MGITEGLYWMRCKKGILTKGSPNEGSGQLQSFKALHRDFPLLSLGGIGRTAPSCNVMGFDGKTKLGRGSIGVGRWLRAFAVAV